MIKWNIADYELTILRSILTKEMSKFPEKDTGYKNAKHLLKSLNQAELDIADVICYCDTNYFFQTKTLSISYVIGEGRVKHQSVENVYIIANDEYHGIKALLEDIKAQGIKGRVLVLTDAYRCALALEWGLGRELPTHSENQAPTAKEFNKTYSEVLSLAKELAEEGCYLEFRYKNRAFINDALKIRG